MPPIPSPRRLGLALLIALGLNGCGHPLNAVPAADTAAPKAVVAPPEMQIAAPSPPPPAINVQAARVAAFMPGMRPAPAPQSTARYTTFEDRPWQRVAEAPVSTFSASVDTGSYANVRRFLSRGALPPRDAVRVEELVNYFGYDYAPPPAGASTPFAVDARVVASPWNAERGLVRIAIKGQDLAKQSLQPANLVFLVEVSGSMGPQDRLPLVRAALHLLTQQLRAQDRVGIVSYASGTKVVLAATPGDQKDTIHAAIDTLAAGGATYGEAGIRLAYAQARAGFIDQGINRVLLATDGDLNIGVTNANELKTLVEGERRRGVGLTALGVGDSNYNEALMKKLADVGDGSYHYLDTLKEAHKVLVNEMTSTLATIAQDLKLQVEFNPALVQEYRLIGYELNQLTREQFNDDKVDAGDIGAGHTVTALYEVIPTGAKGSVDPLRYRQENDKAASAGNHASELAWLKLRYKPPGEAQSKLVQVPIIKPAATPTWPALDKADADLRFAAAVAAWGQWLRGSTQIGDYGPAQIATLARSARGADTYGHRAEFETLVALSAGLKR